MKKKMVIIDCYNNYEHRTKYIEEYYKNSYKVYFLTMGFNHITKEKRNAHRKNEILISVNSYKKNVSLKRVCSCYQFSIKMYQILKKIKPDLIYALVPPNYVVKFVSQYKKKYEVKVILDIIDMWPESLIVKNNCIYKYIALYWKGLRDNNLKNSDRIILECNLYNKYLPKDIEREKVRVQYLIRDDIEMNLQSKIKNMDTISFCYLGSINKLIDIEKVQLLMCKILYYRPVVLHIIGIGEKKKIFVEKMKSIGVKVIDHGVVYNEEEKNNIFSQCHFGINIMKKEICVGLTMKSTDYFRSGLPIINNIKLDTEKLIEKYNAGLQLDDVEQCVEQLLKLDIKQYLEMRKNARQVFINEISEIGFNLKKNELLQI